MVYEHWKEQEEETDSEVELTALLLDQSSFKPYAKYIFDGAQSDFDPYVGSSAPFKKSIFRPLSYFFSATEPVLNLPEIDPEVIAILVSIYPEQMLIYASHGPPVGPDADACNMNILYRYGSKNRAKSLLRVVASMRKFPLFSIVYSASTPLYLRPETISTVIANSNTYRIWGYPSLEKLIAYLSSPKLMKLFFKVCPTQSMVISRRFLEPCLKLGVPVKHIRRCCFYFNFIYGEKLTESFQRVLLHCGAHDEPFVFDFLQEYAYKTGLNPWTDIVGLMAADLGYSKQFRDQVTQLT